MKEIRLKYHRDIGIRVNPEINLVQDYVEDCGDDCWDRPFPNLYDYIIWLEDQLDNPIGMQRVNAAEAGKKLRIALLKLQ